MAQAFAGGLVMVAARLALSALRMPRLGTIARLAVGAEAADQDADGFAGAAGGLGAATGVDFGESDEQYFWT
ncbi:MAG: hypothetical protein HC840_31905 [Leptolyngbyaceae cyanobacterium RM2_2_4]|nr:hypothetical protein [bacterium]NJO53249.1 hypothetical protein [Leptolyngbyaceae cyanobacterium RM2_2_4]